MYDWELTYAETILKKNASHNSSPYTVRILDAIAPLKTLILYWKTFTLTTVPLCLNSPWDYGDHFPTSSEIVFFLEAASLAGEEK